MINVNQITSQLAKMPDQALQQYAMMHKNDPYTVSLALSESNRRKQMRDAAQGQQGMAPQPKVVDQGIASMAAPAPQPQMPQEQAQPMPEDVGIGALPAPNMQGMAGGGIVAFGDGGDVQHFQSGGSAFENWLNSNITPAEQKRRAFLQQQAEANRVGLVPESLLAETARNRQLVADQGFTRGDVRFPAGLALDTPPVPKVDTPPVDKGLAALGGAPRAPAAALAPAVAEKDFLTLQKEFGEQYGPAVDPLAARKQALITKEKEGEEAALAQRKLEQKAELDEMFKGREERTSKKEAALKKSEDTYTGLALLGAAAEMFTGPGNTGIAKGAQVGIKAYGEGLDKINSAKEKIDEARDRMEELRQNQSSMNKREVRDAEKGIRALVYQGERDLIKGVETSTGKKEADVRAAVTSAMAVTQADKARATTLEAARIAAGPGMERNKLLAASQNDQAKLRKDFGTLQTKVMSELGKDPAYTLEQDPIKKTALYNNALRAALQNNPFLSSYAAGIGFASAPSGAVRTLDADE